MTSAAHPHTFHTASPSAERGTRAVLWITLVMMVAEIAAGWLLNSMALLADGLHMSSHAVAIGLSAVAYAAARRYARDERFAFGTWKIEILGAFASAVFLLAVVAAMVFGSIERLLAPQAIHYKEAMVVAAIGLVVNVVCALILARAQHGPGGHSHGHAHAHDHAHGHGHGHGDDLNLRSAYVHVLADAATSVLAIVALAGGWAFDWAWLDPVVALVGAVVIAVWAKGLLTQAGLVLLDREMDHPVVDEIREVIEAHAQPGDTRLVDLHVWRVGTTLYSVALTVETDDAALDATQVREWLSIHEEIVHSTIEVVRHGSAAAAPSGQPPALA